MDRKFTLPRTKEKTALEPPELNLAQLRAQKIAREHKERFERISQRLLDIVIEEKVTVTELPQIVSLMTGRVNSYIDGAKIEHILNLSKELANDKIQ